MEGNLSSSHGLDVLILSDICAGRPFWDGAKLDQPTPEISPCFTETVLVWGVFGFLWLAAIPFVLYTITRDENPPLPWSKFQISKIVLTVVIAALVIADIVLQSSNGYMCYKSEPPTTASYISVGVKLATLVLVLILEQFMRRLGVKTSGIPFVFWCLVAVSDILPVYIAAKQQPWCSTSTVLCVRLAAEWLQLLLHCFADQYSRPGYHELGKNPCPEENASVLNRVTYSWVTSLIIQAYKTTLTSRDLWEQTTRLTSRKVVPKVLKTWRHEQKKLDETREERHIVAFKTLNGQKSYANDQTSLLSNGFAEADGYHSVAIGDLDNKRKGPSLYKVLFKTFGWMWIEACCYKILGDTFNLLQPVVLQQIIAIIEKRDEEGVGETGSTWQGYTFTVALFATSLLKSVLYHCTFNHMVVIGFSVKTALIGTVYRKALTLSNSAKKSSTVGEIVNLMSVDCQRIQDGFLFSHYIISLPFMVAVSMTQLWYLMGVAMFGGLAVVVVATLINGYLGRVQQRLQIQILSFKSKRIKVLNELLNGIKVLKMYTWEEPFQKRVLDMRQEELSRLWKYALLTATAIMISVHSPFMVNYVLVLIYTLKNSVHYLDAQTAFVTLSLVNILRGPITITPFVITGFIQGVVSIGRIQAFLWKEDINEDNIQVVEKGKYAIRVDRGNFTWNKKVKIPTLRNINLKIREKQIYAVVGQVGCGKSSLIAAILGEMEKLEGNVTVKGRMAYVPQEAWIQNLTVRDNILFGKDMDEQRYNKVLSGCAMLPDLEILSAGDMTEIGEKGINISGGQKQRVSLARALYSDADVFLMDDPLSAVDSHVGKHLFKNVIGPQGLLKHKTRILVTHGIHWLPMVDKILVMVNGKISESGTYEELIAKKGSFAQVLQTYIEEEADVAEDGEDAEMRQIREKVLSDVESVTGVTSTDSEDTGTLISQPKEMIIGEEPVDEDLDSDGNLTAEAELVRRRRRVNSEREASFGMSFSKTPGMKDESAIKDNTVGKLIQDEESQRGAVKFSVFKAYARAMGLWSVPLVMLFMLAFQSLNVFSNYWLTYWTEDPLLKNTSQGHTEAYNDTFVYYLIWYTVIGVIQGGAIMAFGVLALTRMVRASGRLHGDMLKSILRSPMAFFDTTPIGRVMNRFSSDIDVMDDRLPLNFRMWSIQIFSTLATVVVVSINTPPFMIVIVPTLVIYIMLLRFFLPTARQVKRLESVLRSPIYNHFSETITGAHVIRAYRSAERFILESQERVDRNIKFFFAAMSASRWIGIRLEFLGNLLVFAATIFSLLSTGLNGAQVGLSINYALQITLSLNLVIQAISELEMSIVSAERVKEYTELVAEAPWSIAGRRPSADWPRSGAVEFRNYRTRYREGLDLVLKGISCHFRSGEKIGIVGRTGAGKSSLTLSLFRLIEAARGQIHLDGRNVADMGLHDLRGKITILPQDPVLFSGSLRSNLDPFERFDDAAIWKAVECAHLKTAVQNMYGQLDYECGEGGSNLSMGQRQLVCLARTLLHKTRVLILDEATAAVDLETDDLIQNTIRTEFSECTILTIAHRLNTILDYDRVLVLSDGQILELDEPGKLLQNDNSAFYKMAKDAGIVN